MEEFLKYPGERIDDLLCDNLKIIQQDGAYKFAIDSVLLANFIKAGKNDRVIDLGTGSGVIPILLYAKTCAKEIIGIEIDEMAFDRASRSVKMNGLEDRVKIICEDLKKAPEIFGRGSFSVVSANPPYMTLNEGKISPNQSIAMARHEVAATLEDVVSTASNLLTFGGRFYIVYRTVRLSDAICEMRNFGLEPKIIRFVHPKPNESPNLFLAIAKKGASAGLKVFPPLVVYNPDGSYTDEIIKIYFENHKERQNVG